MATTTARASHRVGLWCGMLMMLLLLAFLHLGEAALGSGENPVPPTGTVIALKGGRRNLFCSDNPQRACLGTRTARTCFPPGLVTCDKATAGASQQFTVVRLSNDTLALRGGRDGKYCVTLATFATVSTARGATFTGIRLVRTLGLGCTANAIDARAVFTMVRLSSSTFALKASDGRFCSDDGGGVVCNRDTAGPWETFTLVSSVAPANASNAANDIIPLGATALESNGVSTMPVGGDCLTSASRQYRLCYQGDGNLVLYDGWTSLWASNTMNSSPRNLVMQADGNLVAYGTSGAPLWSSGTAGQLSGPYAAMVRDDGNLVVMTAGGTVIWTTGTAQAGPCSFTIQHFGSRCIHPNGGSTTPREDTFALLWTGCEPSAKLSFQMTTAGTGAIQHINSGQCLWPAGGSPSQGTYLVFQSNVCGDARSAFEWTSGGSLRHVASGLCVHPEGGSPTAGDGTRLLLWVGCDLADNRTSFSRLYPHVAANDTTSGDVVGTC